jgi:hypothetical protein
MRMLVALLLVIGLAVVMTNPTALSSANEEISHPLMMDDLEKPFLVRNRRFLGIDWGCTRKCSSYNWCRIRTATFGNCQYPSGCDCNKFVWEG